MTFYCSNNKYFLIVVKMINFERWSLYFSTSCKTLELLYGSRQQLLFFLSTFFNQYLTNRRKLIKSYLLSPFVCVVLMKISNENLLLWFLIFNHFTFKHKFVNLKSKKSGSLLRISFAKFIWKVEYQYLHKRIFGEYFVSQMTASENHLMKFVFPV